GLWPVGTAAREIRTGARTDFGTPPVATANNPEWTHDVESGWFAQWNKNANAAHDIDVWFLNLFPSIVPRTYEVGNYEVQGIAFVERPEPFVFNNGGYQTLNFVPSMITMILGLMAGELLRSNLSKGRKFGYLAAAACVCLAVGFVMGLFLCP